MKWWKFLEKDKENYWESSENFFYQECGLRKSVWFALSHYKLYKLGIKSFSSSNIDNITLFNCINIH